MARTKKLSLLELCRPQVVAGVPYDSGSKLQFYSILNRSYVMDNESSVSSAACSYSSGSEYVDGVYMMRESALPLFSSSELFLCAVTAHDFEAAATKSYARENIWFGCYDQLDRVRVSPMHWLVTG